MNLEITALDLRVRALEKSNEAERFKEMIENKVNREDFDRTIAEIKHLSIASL